jgi:hypothetical protein
MTILKTNTNKQTELKMNNKDLIKEIHIKQEEIEKEKDIKQELSQIATKLKIELKRKQKILSTHHRQENKLKVRDKTRIKTKNKHLSILESNHRT